MTQSASALAAPATDAGQTRARFGRAVGELLLVGGLTPLLFPLSYLLRRWLGLDAAEYAVGFVFFYGAYVVNDPHFTVTYLLFYRDARARAFGGVFRGPQRARYLLAGFVVPVALVAWASHALATGSARSLGFLVQAMFFLVGWHYVKQGFGVLSVLAARRGVRFLPRERLALLVHCYAGWAYAWASPADAGTLVEEKGVVYTSLAHGPLLERATHVVLLASIAPVVWLLARKWKREGRLPIVTPLVAMLASVWSWSIYSSVDPLVRYMTPALHSVQYLYFVWLLRAPQARELEGPPAFGAPVRVKLAGLFAAAVALGVLFFHAVPSALDAALVPRKGALTSALGATPYFAALYACINLHHYFMDFALWRRDNPETRYLVAPEVSSR